MYIPKEDIVAEQTGEEHLLVDVSTQDIFELNETAWRIWELIGEGLTEGAITEKLLEEYDATEEEIRASVEESVAELLDQGLITTE